MAQADITTLTAAQIAALTPAQLAAYSVDDLGKLTAAQAAGLTADRIGALSADQLTAIAAAVQSYQDLLTAFQAAQDAASAAARAAFLSPLTDITTGDAYATLKAAILALDGDYSGEPFAASLHCLQTGFSNLSVS